MSEREAPKATLIGNKKYKEWIHKDSKKADQKNLPYSFSKPKKSKPSNTYCECADCGKGMFVGSDAILVECSGCGVLVKVKSYKKKGLFNE